MRKPNFYWACYAIIKNRKWEILFQKRKNTGFRDWEYQLPAGHIEWKESMKDCIKRELKEELWIDVKNIDLEINHISHRVSSDRISFDVYQTVKKYSWILKNIEIEKCSELRFFNLKNIKNKEKFWYDLEVIKKIENWEKFSEI